LGSVLIGHIFGESLAQSAKFEPKMCPISRLFEAFLIFSLDAQPIVLSMQEKNLKDRKGALSVAIRSGLWGK
jgi:hypothetical protein